MATYDQYRHGYTLRLTVTETATSVESNNSTITYKLQLISGNNYHFSQFGVGAAITMDGVTVASRSRDNDPYLSIGFNSTLTLLSGSKTIAHAADGTKTIALGYSLNMADYYYTPGSMSGTGSFVCATIPRATAPTLSASSVTLGNAVTISVSGRASASFSHVLTYSVGSATGSIATLNTSTTSYSWTVPAAIADQITTAKEGTVNIVCTTKSGTTTIGTKSVSLKVLVPNTSEYTPTVTGTVTEQNADVLALNLGSGYVVQNKSVLKMTGSGTGKHGASIVQVQYLANGVAVNPDNIRVTTPTGSYSLAVKVTDSRGYTAETTFTKTNLAYANPSASYMTAYRSNSSGTQEVTGEYLHYEFTGAISSLNNKNANQWAIHVQRSGQSTWTSVASGTGYALNITGTSSTDVLDADYSYIVRLTLIDSFTTSEFTSQISTGFTTVDYKASGNGIAFGKASEHDKTFEIAGDWDVMHGGNNVDLVIDQGFDSNTKWRWRRWKSGIAEMWLDMGTVTPTTSTNDNGQYYSENLYVYPPFFVYPWSMTGTTNNYSYICNMGGSATNQRYSFRIGRAAPIVVNTAHNLCLYICGEIYEE